MKNKFFGVLRLFLMLFTYPRQLADAVNRALDADVLDELVRCEWNT